MWLLWRQLLVVVMAGLVPAIHAAPPQRRLLLQRALQYQVQKVFPISRLLRVRPSRVDSREEPGNDAEDPPCNLPQQSESRDQSFLKVLYSRPKFWYVDPFAG
jgi:hypothetical protein